MQREAITVELVGPEMETETADPVVVLSFATAYFKALAHVAEARLGRDLDLHGLTVIDKCVGVASTGARTLLPRAIAVLDDALMDPFERDETVRLLGRARRSLPNDVLAKVFVGDNAAREIRAVEPFRGKLVEVADFQAYVYRVGGHPPSVDLIDKSDANGTKVTLTGTGDDIKNLSKHLYGLVNVVAEVDTNQLTEKRTGRLLGFEPVLDVDPITAWREWFANNVPEWNEVDDVEAELGR
jgi:hypothetical protein